MRGIAKGAGFDGTVRSPSFTIENQYQTPQLLIRHFDFYRLNKGGVVSEELEEALAEPESTVIVEWSGIVQDVLPSERIRIAFTVSSESSRDITIEIPEKYVYIAEGEW